MYLINYTLMYNNVKAICMDVMYVCIIKYAST